MEMINLFDESKSNLKENSRPTYMYVRKYFID